MEHVKVPIVRGETLLLQAIGILKDKDRSGLIVDLPDRPRVLFLDELLRILCDKDGGNVKIDQVRPRYRAVRLPSDRSHEPAGSDPPGPRGDGQQFGRPVCSSGHSRRSGSSRGYVRAACS